MVLDLRHIAPTALMCSAASGFMCPTPRRCAGAGRNQQELIMTTKTKSPKVAAQTSRSAPAAPGSAASARLRKEARAAVAANLAALDSAGGGGGAAPAADHNEQDSPQQPAQPAPDVGKKDSPDADRKPAQAVKAKGKGAAKSPAKPSAKTPKPVKPAKAKRLSCIDAAAQIIGKDPIGCKDLIAEMGQRKLWTSPNGKTPEASLYAAVTREIAAKGNAARFKKVDRGMFVAGAGAARKN